MQASDETAGPEPTTPSPPEPAPEVHPMDAFLEDGDYGLEAPKRGEIRVGTVARVTETDVFIDIGAKSEGVITLRELEQLTEEQRAGLRVGEEVSVYVIRPGGRGGPLELSLARAEEEQDWQRAEELLESKEIFEGEVAGYNKGGLIVQLGQLRGFIPASQVSLARRRRAAGEDFGIEGLIHISELSDRRIEHPREAVQEGDTITLRVLNVDEERRRLGLSLRKGGSEEDAESDWKSAREAGGEAGDAG